MSRFLFVDVFFVKEAAKWDYNYDDDVSERHHSYGAGKSALQLLLSLVLHICLCPTNETTRRAGFLSYTCFVSSSFLSSFLPSTPHHTTRRRNVLCHRRRPSLLWPRRTRFSQ